MMITSDVRRGSSTGPSEARARGRGGLRPASKTRHRRARVAIPREASRRSLCSHPGSAPRERPAGRCALVARQGGSPSCARTSDRCGPQSCAPGLHRLPLHTSPRGSRERARTGRELRRLRARLSHAVEARSSGGWALGVGGCRLVGPHSGVCPRRDHAGADLCNRRHRCPRDRRDLRLRGREEPSRALRPARAIMTPSELVDAVGPHSTPEDVAPLLDHPETDEAHLLRLLRKRELPSSVIEAVARHERWDGRHLVRAAIVLHAKTPRTLSLRLLSLLLWRRSTARRDRHETPDASSRGRGEPAPRETLRARAGREDFPRANRASRTSPNPRFRRKPPRGRGGVVESAARGGGRPGAPAARENPGRSFAGRGGERALDSRGQLCGTRSSRTPALPSIRRSEVLAATPAREIRKLLSEKTLPPVVRFGAERILSGENTSGGRRAR